MKSSLLLLTITLTTSAQTPAFDVASIKPNRSLDATSSIHLSQGRLSAQNVSLKKVILNAYGIPDDRDYMVDGPAWLATERVDIDATFPGDAKIAEVRQMLSAMLTERFRLALHRETRQLPMYSLVVAKGGPRIQPVEDGQGRTSGSAGRLEAMKTTIQKLADLLGRVMGVPVVDSTGLKGVFDFTLEWSPERADAEGGTGPSIFTALQEQLGLRLASEKGPFDVLVVDHMEKTASAN